MDNPNCSDEKCECDGGGECYNDNRLESGGYHNKHFGFDYMVEWYNVLLPSLYNWCTFHLFMLQFEYNKSGPNFEIQFAILGFWFRVSFSLPWETPMSKHLKEIMEEHELNPEGGFMSMPMAELRKMRLGETENWEFKHGDDTYEVRKKQ